MPSAGDAEGIAVRAALDEATRRVAGLLRRVRRPDAPALGEWDVAQLATHLAQSFDIITHMAVQDWNPDLDGIWDLSALTTKLVVGEDERDLDMLAVRIETAAMRFLQVTASSAPDARLPWMVDGTTLTVTQLTGHLLNEVVVHGYDIATADAQPWRVDRAHAALILEVFIPAVVRALEPHALVHGDKAGHRSARYDIRLRGSGRLSITFEDGTMTVARGSAGRADCHLSVDPAAFLLVAWNRINQWQAIPKGQLLAWGRRPWLGLQLRGMIHTP